MSVKIPLLLAVLLFVSACSPPIKNQNSKGKTIVCFGDSLTEGFGAQLGEDYPSVLSALIHSIPVINAGVSGDTSGRALERLEPDVLNKNPRIVIITLGGNDFLSQVPKSVIIANMRAIIRRIQSQGAMVVWAVVKTGLFSDQYIREFKVLAKETQILLIPDILAGIMFQSEYKADHIHPNAAGYKIMAERIYKHIQPFLKS